MLVSITIIYIESLNTNYVQTTLNCPVYLTSLLGYRDNCVKSLKHIIKFFIIILVICVVLVIAQVNSANTTQIPAGRNEINVESDSFQGIIILNYYCEISNLNIDCPLV